MTYKRNEAGLLEGVDYKFNDDGSVDWRSMIDPKHLYPNKGWFESRGEPMVFAMKLSNVRKIMLRLNVT